MGPGNAGPMKQAIPLQRLHSKRAIVQLCGNRDQEAAVEIAPLSEHTGAEVRGVDLREAVPETVKAPLNRAFAEHSVLVIRDQHLAPKQVLAAVSLFGTVFQQHKIG